MYLRTRLCTLLISTIMIPSFILAQTTSGSITGSVIDANQAAVANATIKITDDAKNYTLTMTSDTAGRFVFPQVPPATYTMTIEAKGFKKMQKTGILLVANDKLTLGDLMLQVGEASETVNVVAEATLVQTQSAERSYAIQSETVRNIAVNGRNFTALASIAPGLAVYTSMGTPSTGTPDDITNVSANGLRTSANNIQIDGVAAMDTGNNGEMVAVVLDSIAEFKVLTSNYQAEYGRSAGAQISAVTKSGTNEFHGSFYVFRRDDGMNANTWLNNRDSTPENPINKPRLDQRDIGYTIGGPVYIPKVFNKNKDKLFFFFSQEHQKRFTPPDSPTRVMVPTALERKGDFSQSVDGSGNPFPYIRNPFDPQKRPCTPQDTSGCFQDGGVLGRIPAANLNPYGLAILNMYPMPNTTGVGYNYISEDSTNNPQRQDLYRGDWNISNNWRATGKFLYYKNGPTLPYGSFVLGTNMPDFAADFPNNRYGVTGTVTGTLNPTTVLEVTFGQSHNFIDIVPDNPNFNRANLGLSNIPLLYPGAVQLDLPPQFIFDNVGSSIPNGNGPNIGTNNAPFHNFNTTRDWSVSLSKVHGSHSVKVGLFWQNSFKPQSSFANNNGQYNFSNDVNNPLDTGFSFANAAVGVYNSFTQASGYFTGDYRYNNVEWYAQDNWKVTSRLTLDYGIRFYWIQPQFDELSQTANFLPGQFNPADAPLLFRPGLDASGNRVAVNPLTGEMIDATNIGLLVPNTGNPMNGILQAGQGIEQGLYQNRGVNYAPRFGFGYDVLGNQRLVIRGGGGVFYDRPQGNTVFDLLQNPPTTIQPTLFHGLINNVGSGQALLAPPNLVAIDHDGKIPTTYSFNFGVQSKLPFDSVLDVSYVGTVASHLLQRRNINAPAYGAAYLPQNQDPTAAPSDVPGAQALPVDFLRPYQGYGNILYIEPAGSSNYHSLQVSVNRRFSRGLLLGVNYTWSKALGTQSQDLPAIDDISVPNNVDQRRVNYAPLDFNIPNNLNINWVWQMPKATQNRKLGYALNDWQLSGIYRYVTGLPYNVTFTIPGISAYTLTGTQQVGAARVVLLGNPGSGSSSDPYHQFDVSAFTVPGTGSMSLESGLNFLHRAPINNFDLSLSKRFRFKERLEFEFRLDAFNAFNHTQFNDVNANLQVASLTDPTPTNLASETGDRTGFGAIQNVRPPRNLQWSMRFQF